MDKDSKQVVVLLTHPNIKESRANKALMDAISDMGEVSLSRPIRLNAVVGFFCSSRKLNRPFLMHFWNV